MATENVNIEMYRKQADGSVVLETTETIEIEVISEADKIAAKEAQLLEMYAELEALKNNSAE